MMLGLLLARAGVEVQVLEKHADFLRDFRGDTLHPSTLEVIAELGLLDELLKLPHDRVSFIGAQFGNQELHVADFSRLPTRCRFIAMMPQWDFLNFLAAQAARYPNFTLRVSSEVRSLAGLDAALVVGADGRHSTVRGLAGLEVEELGAPIDVLWFRLSRKAGDPDASMGRFAPGAIFVLINRRDYWQCGYVIPKGAADAVRAEGLPSLQKTIARIVPFTAERVSELATWDQVKLLTVQIDRLKRWYAPGVLCIGDAAHAMSPVGGVGINIAIQDAVATANILAAPLLAGSLSIAHLETVQRRREWPVRLTQRLQILAQDRVIKRVLASDRQLEPPLLIRLLARSAWLQQLPGRLIGMGVRPEHVRTSAATPGRAPPGTTG
jgi:2-polyprenyl-6-methoxyphenol hydroxylase-like FAD-dependent oxidoreductase